jgi:hypothetical protein
MRRAEFLNFWEPQPPEALRACPGLYRVYFPFYKEEYGLYISRAWYHIKILFGLVNKNQEPTQKFSLLGADREAIYNLRWILKTIL